MKRTLIFQDDEHMENTVDLLEAARRIYGRESYETYGIVINRPLKAVRGHVHCLISIQDEDVKLYDLKRLTDILEELQGQYGFDSILIPATPLGRMLAPRLAMRLHTGLVADVTDIRRGEEGLEIIRPAFCGRIMAGIATTGTGPVMISVRPDVFSYSGNPTLETAVIEHSPSGKKNEGIQCLGVQEKETTYDIRQSEILISGGAGVKRDFPLLDRLAEELSGQVSASRKIVDKGMAPRSIQVGQSGKTVSPKLYIALGINGAMQHVEGLKNIESIIAVNTNRNAPLCSLSDIVVEGDALEFIRKLVERIREYKKEKIGESI